MDIFAITCIYFVWIIFIEGFILYGMYTVIIVDIISFMVFKQKHRIKRLLLGGMRIFGLMMALFDIWPGRHDGSTNLKDRISSTLSTHIFLD